MTEEVTDAMVGEGVAAYLNALSDTPLTGRIRAAYLAMEAARVPASNSPTTNGEASQRAASDDEVGLVTERIFTALLNAGPIKPSQPSYMWSQLRRHAEVAALAALSTPTTDSDLTEGKK